MKTPIGAVSILAEAIEGAADDPEAIRHFSQRLTAESSRLSALVTQIIDLSRYKPTNHYCAPNQWPSQTSLTRPSHATANKLPIERCP
ncbi:phosphate regulon sensor protein PhoR [Cutibacterium acnes JCM 18920]|nr:phosphate regulon sensor protein PhoR [Cutibacterium acnes JCM 18920]